MTKIEIAPWESMKRVGKSIELHHHKAECVIEDNSIIFKNHGTHNWSELINKATSIMEDSRF